jgi:LPS export ABC transporter permease LptG/LPS export ABC transporter permease LptF
MYRIIDRYVVREIGPPFLILLLMLTFVLEMQPVMDIADKLIAKGVAWSVIFRMLPTLLPQALALTIPMSLLIALLMALGRLSADREWVALQACGVSAYRLLRPIGIVAVAGWAVTSYIIIVALPSANQTFREISYGVVASRAEGEVKPRVFFDDFPNIVLYVRDVRPGVAGWSDVFAAETSRPGQPVVYLAKRGRMAIDRAKRTVSMVLEDGSSHTTGRTSGASGTQAADTYEVSQFRQVVLNLDPETVFPRSGPQKGDREMTVAELQQRIVELRRQGLSPAITIMELQKKYSIPVACLVFGVIGLALGISTRREGKLASFVLGIAVIFVYYVVMWLAQSLARGDYVSPWVAMWLPNLVLGGVGAGMLMLRAAGVERFRILLPFLSPAAPPAGGDAAAAPDARSRQRVVVVVRVPRFSLPRPNILDGYIARIYLRILALAFAGLLSIFYISTFLDLSDRVFRGTATIGLLLDYLYYATPQFIYFVLPLSALIATLVTIGLLTKNSELVVMKACGISLYRAALPLLFFAALASGALFVLEENVLPAANRRAEGINHQIRFGAPRTVNVVERNWIAGKDGEIYHYVYFDPRRQTLNRLSIYEFSPGTWRLVRRTFVNEAAFDPHARTWHARDGWVREFSPLDAASDQPVVVPSAYRPFASRELRLEGPEYFATEQPDAERMTYSQLKQYVGELQASGFNAGPYLVALHRKLAFPFVALVMTLIAVPFAVTTGRRGALYGVGLGIVLAMVYWITANIFAAIGSGGLIAPTLAAWAPNLMFGAGAAYLLLTVRT